MLYQRANLCSRLRKLQKFEKMSADVRREMKPKVRIQPSFVLSYLAIALLAVTTILLNNLSLPDIEASTSNPTRGQICDQNSPVFKGESTLTDQEKLNFGDGSRAWVVKRNSNNQDQQKTFRVILGVREVSSAGDGGIVEFTVALGNLNDETYSEDEGRVWLWVGEKNTPLDFLYDTENSLNLHANNYWVGKRNLLVEDYEGVKISFELLTGDNKNSRGCVSNALSLEEAFGLVGASPTATSSTTTITASASTTASSSATTTVLETVQTWEIESGFSAWVVPDEYDALDATGILDAGMYVYQFNYSGNEDWKIYSVGSASPLMYSGVGYYIYNPKDFASVKLNEASYIPDNSARVVKKGWNLVANSSDSDLNLSNATYPVIKAGYQTCDEGDLSCADEVTLKELLSGQRAYGKIYVIKDVTATTATKAFDILEVTEDNIDAIEIDGKTSYWVYLYK